MKKFLEYTYPKEEIDESVDQSQEKTPNILESFSKSYTTFQENLERASQCIKQFEEFDQLKENLVSREELQTLLATQLILINENINDVRSYIKGINQQDLERLSKSVYNIQAKTENLLTYVNEELPATKNKIYETDLTFSKKVNAIESAIQEAAKTIVELDVSTTEKLHEYDRDVKHIGSRVEDLTEQVNEEISSQIKSLYEEVSNANKEVTLLEEKYTPVVNRITEFQKEIESIRGISEQYVETIADAKKEIAQVINEVNEIFINDKYMELDRKVQQVNEIFESLKGKSKLNEEVPPASPVQMGMDAPQVASLTAKVRWLEQSLGRIIHTGPGSGEVNLRWLDDIDRSTIANGKFLRYNGTTKKFEFATVSGGGGGGVTSYNDLTDLPTLFSGDYNDLTNKPTIPAAQIQSDWNQTNNTSLDYIKNKPTIPSLTGYATESYVTTQITNLINGAPGTLDTLKEIADQLAADESAVSALTSTVAGKIGLTNLSVTTASASGSGSLSYNNTSGVFTFTPPSLSGYVTSSSLSTTLSSYVTSSSLTTTLSGYVTTSNFTWTNLSGKPTFATVATTGSYTDLTNTPTPYTLPTASGSTLGGIKVGTGLSIDGSGVLTTTVAPGGNATFNNITTTGQIVETFQTYSTSIGSTQPITLDCTGGNIFNITSTVTQNWTAAFTNLSLGTGKATNTTLIINQGATAWIPTAMSVNGTSTTINWQGGTAPTGSANKKDVIAFSILQTGASTYLVFGQLVTFG